MGRGQVNFAKVLSNAEIEYQSIRVVDREGDRVSLQCKKADINQLPKYGIGCGSSCLVVDAETGESAVYIYHSESMHDMGEWFVL